MSKFTFQEAFKETHDRITTYGLHVNGAEQRTAVCMSVLNDQDGYFAAVTIDQKLSLGWFGANTFTELGYVNGAGETAVTATGDRPYLGKLIRQVGRAMGGPNAGRF